MLIDAVLTHYLYQNMRPRPCALESRSRGYSRNRVFKGDNRSAHFTYDGPPQGHSSVEENMSRANRSINIMASEVGDFIYCAKAWHLKRCGEIAQVSLLKKA
jgi:hypothetical protein